MTIVFDEDKQNQRLRQLRVDEEEQAMEMLAEKYQITYVDLTRIPINTDALRLIPEEEARANGVAVFDIVGKKLSVAIHSPSNEDAQNIIKEHLEAKGYLITKYMASIQSLTKAWDRYKDLSFAFETEAGSLDISNDEVEQLIEKTKKLEDITVLIKEALAEKKSHRISKVLAIIMAGAFSTKGSDIHIEPEADYARIRYRLDGVLIEVLQFDSETYSLLLSRIKLLSGLKLNIKEAAQDGRFTVKVYMSDVEIRCSTIPGAYGESVVMRILNPKSISVPLESLGMPKRLYDILQAEIARPNGMILTTGPTGSGKTTTLYACLRHIQSPEFKIITIEDPIEYHLPGIVQTQVEEKKGYTFESGLRSAMRQDPDIIMVGEIRDGETAMTAIQASLTGHLVFSTLHTNNAAGTFTRLIDLGADSKVLTSAIHLALAQRLVRVLCKNCTKKIPMPADRAPLVEKILASMAGYEEAAEFTSVPSEVWDAVGCEACNKTGYKGRLGVFEGILADRAIEEVIREIPSEREIKNASLPQKIIDMRQDGILKVLRGITTFQELERVVDLAAEIQTEKDAGSHD
ncbi:MAG: type pilus assembly ATPase PilB, type pilus assembly protein PilB [Candidatus Parcubacteria bacterium]|jgi:type II secretory ATPase GspE/PulE/Tfp pilus assembly ATPase PilB-like protein